MGGRVRARVRVWCVCVGGWACVGGRACASNTSAVCVCERSSERAGVSVCEERWRCMPALAHAHTPFRVYARVELRVCAYARGK